MSQTMFLVPAAGEEVSIPNCVCMGVCVSFTNKLQAGLADD